MDAPPGNRRLTARPSGRNYVNATLLAAVLLAATLAILVGSWAVGNRVPSAEAATVRDPDAILGAPRYSQAQVTRYARSKGSTRFILETIPYYYKLAPKVGIAPDVLVAQAMVETGYGRYGGDSKPWNMAGIKKGGNVGDAPKDFERPATAKEGVRMHINHMAAYTGRPTIGKPHDRYYDARAAQQNRGYWVRRIHQLGNGVWATDPSYSQKIRSILDDMSRY